MSDDLLTLDKHAADAARWVFVGVGGVCMSSLCRLAHHDRVRVLGCDREANAATEHLRALGIPVAIGHSENNIPPDATLVVYSLAIPTDAPELRRARRMGIPCVPRPAFFGAYMRRYTTRIAVSGAHGKSTVTAMLHAAFAAADTSPTTLCGTDGCDASSLVIGGCSHLIFEACEYRAALLSFSPSTQVILNVDWDHPDCYDTPAAMQAVFFRAAEAAPTLVVCADDVALRSMAAVHPRAYTFGEAPDAWLRYEITGHDRGRFCMRLYEAGTLLGELALRVPGRFQCANAVAAVCVARVHGLPFAAVRDALADFRGIHRRLEPITLADGREVYYDYAHHPTEVTAACESLRLMSDKPLCAVFRPHTYSRTAALWDAFVQALRPFDALLLTDIYPARESAMEGITSERLAAAVGAHARYVPLAALAAALPSDAYTTVLMGAGDLRALVHGAKRRNL